MDPNADRGDPKHVVILSWFTAKDLRYEDYVEFSDTETDSYGMPKMTLHYELTAKDKENLARALYEQGLALLREIGNRQGIAECLARLGGVALRVGLPVCSAWEAPLLPGWSGARSQTCSGTRPLAERIASMAARWSFQGSPRSAAR